MNRSLDWLHQARADLAQAKFSRGAEHREWAYFAYRSAGQVTHSQCPLHYDALSR